MSAITKLSPKKKTAHEKKKELKIDTLNRHVSQIKGVFSARLKTRIYNVYYNKATSQIFTGKQLKSSVTFKFLTDSSRSDLMQQVNLALSQSEHRYKPKYVQNSNLSGMGHIQFTADSITFYFIVKYRNERAFKTLRYSNLLMDESKWQSTYRNRTPDTSEEHSILHKINAAIYKLGNEDAVTITLKPNDVYHDVIGFIPGPSGSHADFVGIDKNLKEVCFLSHKKGNSPKQFQQYSGISALAGKSIHLDDEVKEFRKVISEKDSSEFKSNSFSKAIKSKGLKSKAIFGSDYDTRNEGYNSCTHFMQGAVTISKKRNKTSVTEKAHLVISFNGKNVHRSNISQLDRSGYRPVLGARRGESTRSVRHGTNRVTGVRGGIFPEAYIKGRNNTEL